MEFFYLASLFPIIVGTIFFIKQKQINWYEYLASCGICLILAGIFHVSAVVGMTDDIETFSGQISKATHYPWWKEKYTVTETYYTGSGKNRKSHTRRVTKYRDHPEHWVAYTTFGEDQINGPDHRIDVNFFNEISRNFKDLTTEKPWKSGLVAGDPHIYVAYNRSKYVYPVTDVVHFKNRLKAAPSVYTFPKVPEDMKGLYEWPKNEDWTKSDRVLGSAILTVDVREFDLMNSRLGPKKFVNVIIVGFGSADSSMAHWQQAKWVGGKKNDIVLCYGGLNTKPSWTYVFGWSESELCKRHLENILLSNPVDTRILPLIEEEIRKNYVIKDWSKFDYIKIKPPTWSYIVFIIVLFGSMIGCWWWFYNNEFGKEGNSNVGYSRFGGFGRSNWPNSHNFPRFR